jgi:beta-barrel assembly-enhancing protease
MKHAALALVFVLSATPVYAQLGGLRRAIGKAEDAKNKADKLADMHFTDKEERQLGEHVSTLLIDRFGVFQDKAVARYVSLVGSVLAQAGPRPDLAWEFIVLDSDNVNAYAAPGGLIHITRGALGLMKNEAELASVLGHEIAHITEKHTINAIKKANATELGIDAGAARAPGGALASTFVSALGGRIYQDLFENKFDRGDEMESDEVGITLASKVGYAPSGMIGFLNKIAERNKSMEEPNGIFASHPQIKDRISEIEETIKDENLKATATAAARYSSTITFDAVPPSAIVMDIEGVRGAVGDSTAKKEEPKKKGLLGGFGLTRGKQAESSQTMASAGARGGVPDRDAVGGSNKNKVSVTITPAEIMAFLKGISA